ALRNETGRGMPPARLSSSSVPSETVRLLHPPIRHLAIVALHQIPVLRRNLAVTGEEEAADLISAQHLVQVELELLQPIEDRLLEAGRPRRISEAVIAGAGPQFLDGAVDVAGRKTVLDELAPELLGILDPLLELRSKLPDLVRVTVPGRVAPAV